MPILAAAPGLSSVVAGSYRATWAGLDLGTVSNQGINLRYRNSSIPVTADIAGELEVDRINSGTTATITMVLQDWNAQGLEAMIWWMGTLKGFAGYNWGDVQSVGAKEWAVAKPLVLTACHVVGGAPAASNPTIDPLSITFFKTIIAPDSDIDVLFSFRPRFVTVTLTIFPVQLGSGGTINKVTGCGDISLWTAIRSSEAHLGNVSGPL